MALLDAIYSTLPANGVRQGNWQADERVHSRGVNVDFYTPSAPALQLFIAFTICTG